MDQQSLERIRKRKRDDDDELFFFILPALYLYLKNTEKTKSHSSITYGRRKVRRLLNGHLKDCLTAFRMEPEIFRWIASYLRTEGLVSDSDTIKVEEKLAFFLYMLSHNASYEDLQVAFQHSASTFHDYLNEFFDVVPILASRFLRPRHIDRPHPRIANDDRFFPYFENCLGAIDGSHVPVTRSPQLQAPWRNRKGSLSQNVMFACDFDLNVTFISCGWEGSATDARVLSSALLNCLTALLALFAGSIAEGNFNFTSTSTTSREDLTQVISDDDEPEGDTEADIAERESEDEHEVMDPAPSAQSMTQVEHQVKGKRVAAARNKLAKIPKRSSKKRNSDGIVQVMERMVQVREKEVTQEQPLQKFSITRCMDALKTLDGMTGSIKIPALDVFKIADNREIFLNLVDDKDDKDGTAMTWLLAQIAKLP